MGETVKKIYLSQSYCAKNTCSRDFMWGTSNFIIWNGLPEAESDELKSCTDTESHSLQTQSVIWCKTEMKKENKIRQW